MLKRPVSSARAGRSVVMGSCHVDPASEGPSTADIPSLYTATLSQEVMHQRVYQGVLLPGIPTLCRPILVQSAIQWLTSLTSGLSELTDIVARLQRKIAILEQGNQVSSREEVSEHGIGALSHRHDVVETQHMQDSAPGSSPVFAGPTSAEFSFGVANIILEQETGASPGQSKLNPELAAALSSHENEDQNVPTSQGPISPSEAALPLHGLQVQDTIRLIQLYHETVGILHPIVEIDALVRTANSIFSVHSNVADSFTTQPTTLDLAQLKMVLAIALLGEGGGSCPLAKVLHEELKQVISSQTMARTFTLEGQALLLLTVSRRSRTHIASKLSYVC